MRILTSALLSVAVLLAVPSLALAQAPAPSPAPSAPLLDTRPAFETEYWVGASVHSQNSGLRLLCTLQSKNTPDQNITMTLDNKFLSMTVSQRVQPRATTVTLSSQGAPVVSNQNASFATLRTISGITLPSEMLETLRTKSAIEIQVKDDPQPMLVMLNGFAQAAEQLANCMK